ncbi:MAG: hypothetical protein R2690_11555 [Acidimicrobiales bacterium]
MLPDGFRFGVSDSGYQAEGSYNGGEPANNWAAWEASGRAVPTGAATVDPLPRALRRRLRSRLRRRTSVEWTRVEPRPSAVDHEAIEHYGAPSCGPPATGASNRSWRCTTSPTGVARPGLLAAPRHLRRFANWAELIVPHLAPYRDGGSRSTRSTPR